jgi:hypothetical protein
MHKSLRKKYVQFSEITNILNQKINLNFQLLLELKMYQSYNNCQLPSAVFFNLFQVGEPLKNY